MNCKECSGPVEPDQRFCNWCGVELHATPEADGETSESSEAAPIDQTGPVDSGAPSTGFATPTGEPIDQPDQPPTLVIPVPPELTGNERTALFKPDFAGRDTGPQPSASAHANVAKPTSTTDAPDGDTTTVGSTTGDAGADSLGDTQAIAGTPPVANPAANPALTDETATAVAAAIASEGTTTTAAAPLSEPVATGPTNQAPAPTASSTEQVQANTVDPNNDGATAGNDATDELARPSGAGDVEPVALVPESVGGDGDSDSMWSPGYVAAVVTVPPAPRLEAPMATPPATPYDLAAGAATTVTPAVDSSAAPATMVMPAAPAVSYRRQGFRMSPLFIVSAIGAIVAAAGMFFNMVEIASDVPLEVAPGNTFGFSLGQWSAGDLAGNLPIAGIIVAVGMIGGAFAGGFGYRWGAGLAGGSGAAAVGVAMLALGLAQYPIDAAQRAVAIPSEQQYILSITRDVGYWLQVATAAIGLVALWASFADARADHRRSLNPWIAALGALATLVAAIGPMVPVGQGLVSDNWYLIDAIGEPSQLLIIARLVQIAMFAVTGVVGFLIVSRYGLGLVFGGSLAAAWLTMSTVLDLTSNPVGFGFRNPGETVMQVHGVTIIGVAATLASALIACAAVLEQNARNR